MYQQIFFILDLLMVWLHLFKGGKKIKSKCEKKGVKNKKSEIKKGVK